LRSKLSQLINGKISGMVCVDKIRKPLKLLRHPFIVRRFAFGEFEKDNRIVIVGVHSCWNGVCAAGRPVHFFANRVIELDPFHLFGTHFAAGAISAPGCQVAFAPATFFHKKNAIPEWENPSNTAFAVKSENLPSEMLKTRSGSGFLALTSFLSVNFVESTTN
jgi:hypothetical protein